LSAQPRNRPAEASVLSEIADGVAHLTLNRPEKRNALSLEMMLALKAALREASAAPGVRAIVIAGSGPAFSAGHDLAEMVGRDASFYQDLFDECTRLMTLIHELPQPVIARVHGVATAAGCQLVASCDLAIASEQASFATPGVRIGLFCSTPMVAVSRAVGRKRSLQMLLTGQAIDAHTAADWGLVNAVVAADRLDAAVADLVAAIDAASSLTVSIGKRAFYDQVDLPESGAYELTKAVMATNAELADAQEGICAFLDKRRPVWTGS
jgi:enoyl-CoA hydratase/carnithine racemase